MVRHTEVEESMELCMRFMMVSCEVVERKRVLFKAVLINCGGLAALSLFWIQTIQVTSKR